MELNLKCSDERALLEMLAHLKTATCIPVPKDKNSYLYHRTKSATSNNGPNIFPVSRGQKQPPVPEDKSGYLYQRTR